MRAGARTLAEAGIDTPAVEAKLLMEYALASEPQEGDPRIPVGGTELFMRGNEAAPGTYERWLRLRAARVPLQHIVGSASFDGLDFLASPAGFVPRPETELLVEWAFARAQQVEGPLTIVDVCSGPGTIALALAARLCSFPTPTAHILGLEVDPDALELARANEAQLRRRGLLSSGVTVEFQRADLREPGDWEKLAGSAQLVLSNPPYVPEEALEKGLISEEVCADPHHAVFGGADGMSLMDPLARCMKALAIPGAFIAVEHDDAAGKRVRNVLAAAGMEDVEQHRDFAERDRFVTARISAR